MNGYSRSRPDLRIMLTVLSFIFIIKLVQTSSDFELLNNETASELNNLRDKLLKLMLRSPDAAWIHKSSKFWFTGKHNRNMDNDQALQFDNLLLNDDNDLNQTAYALSTSTVNRCNYDLIYLMFNIKKMWTIQMLDAAGKLPSGLLQGNFYWMGDFKECRNVTVPEEVIDGIRLGGFNGEYCYITWDLRPNPQENTVLPISIGICVPDSCTEETLLNDAKDIAKFIKYIPAVKKVMKYVNNTQITCQNSNKIWENGQIAYMCVLMTFVALVVIGTVCDIVQTCKKNSKNNAKNNNSTVSRGELIENSNMFSISSDNIITINREEPDTDALLVQEENSESALLQFFICFSAYTNGAKIFDVKHNKNEYACLHGIRLLNMNWIIMGHSFIILVFNSDNLLDALDFANKFYSLIIIQATYSVDTFFLLSGLLLSYNFLKRHKGNDQSISWIYYYLHRIWRLTPTFAMILGFYATLWLRVGSGPFWPKQTETGNCTKSWWWNLLYIHNFKDFYDMCMGWTWYLACDMQFYVISPLFLILLLNFSVAGIIVICIVLSTSLIVTGYLGRQNDMVSTVSSLDNTLSIELNMGHLQDSFQDYFNTLFDKPYCRIGPYLIGILTGYIIYKMTDFKKPLRKIYVTICWLIAIFLGLSIMFGIYRAHFGSVVATIYNSLSRTAWSIAVAWMIFACLSGFGGRINRILCSKVWIPLSRLSYSAYLIHPVIIEGYCYALYRPIHFQIDTLLLYYFGFFVSSYLAAFLVSMTFESPMMALEKLLLTRFFKK